MRLRIAVLFCGLVGACLEVPPAIDEASVAPGQTPNASTSQPDPETVSTAPAPAPTKPRTVAKKPATACPIATGRHTFCEGRRICSRDHDGCEECVCNTEQDASRAKFEQTNPWDMRQR